MRTTTAIRRSSHFRRRHSKIVKWLEAIRDKRTRTGAK